MTHDRVEVLIVGAGPTGLALAAQLRRFGVRVVSLPLFDLGLEDTEYPFLLFLSQAETEEVLGEHLAGRGVPVERGVELTAFDVGADAVACRLRHADGRTVRIDASYVIGCDGAHSTVRHGAGIAFEGDAYPQTFALADVEVTGALETGCVHAYMGARGTLFFFPLGHPATWRLQSMLPHSKGAEDSPGATGEPTLDALQRIVDAFTGGDLRLHDPAWRTYFRVHHRQAASYRAGGDDLTRISRYLDRWLIEQP